MNNGILENLTIQFQKKREIGKNGFNSQVFEALEVKINRTIAIKKILKKDLKKNYNEEAVLLNKSQHPNVVSMHYAGEGKALDENNVECEYIYLAMPLYKNGSLKEIIQQETTLLQLFKYVFGILNGMLHIHAKGIIHLDLKPDNILVSDRFEALITDFGVATQFDIETSVTKNKNSLLMFLYPPETLINKDVTIQSDIYQIGVLLYLLFNKMNIDVIANLFDLSIEEKRKETVNEIKEKIKNGILYPKNFVEHVPDKVRCIILKCMDVNPNKRYKSVEEIRNEFASINENDNRLLWKYKKNNDEKIWTRCNSSKIEKCILMSSGKICYQVYKEDKLICEKEIKEDLNIFFNSV